MATFIEINADIFNVDKFRRLFAEMRRTVWDTTMEFTFSKFIWKGASVPCRKPIHLRSFVMMIL